MITLSEAQLYSWISPVFWPFLRVLAVFTSAPVFSSRSIPIRAKVALAFFVAVACQASLPSMPIIGFNDSAAFETTIQQVIIGLSIGFAVRAVFAAVELAGEVVGFQMGLNFAAFFDPSMNAQTSAMGRFFGQMTALLFVVMNGHFMVVMAVSRSFEAFPVGGRIFQNLEKLRLFQLGSDIFASGLWIALPMVGMLMFVNLALGIVSRVAPQMNIFAVGFPVTLAVGLLGVALTLPLLEGPYISLVERSIALFVGV